MRSTIGHIRFSSRSFLLPTNFFISAPNIYEISLALHLKGCKNRVKYHKSENRSTEKEEGSSASHTAATGGSRHLPCNNRDR
jgi:hypothetical protein